MTRIAILYFRFVPYLFKTKTILAKIMASIGTGMSLTSDIVKCVISSRAGYELMSTKRARKVKATDPEIRM